MTKAWPPGETLLNPNAEAVWRQASLPPGRNAGLRKPAGEFLCA